MQCTGGFIRFKMVEGQRLMQEELFETPGGSRREIIFLKRSLTGNPPGFSAETVTAEEEETKEEKGIICRFCKNVITTPEQIIQMSGHYRHIFTNPVGVTYEIGCFSTAMGCVRFGEPTDEFTWFPGFLWSYALCSKCYTHLGWYYQSGTNGFYGLILENLIENG